MTFTSDAALVQDDKLAETAVCTPAGDTAHAGYHWCQIEGADWQSGIHGCACWPMLAQKPSGG